MDPLDVDSSAVLADLAREYERSCLVITQIEDRLKERFMACSANGTVEVEHLVPENALDPPAEASENDASVTGNVGFSVLAKRAAVRMLGSFSRKLQLPKRASLGCSEAAEATRRISVVDMSAAALPKRSLPRRAASFYSSGSAALQSTTGLNRRAPVNSLRQQLQQELEQQQHVQTASDATSSPAATSKTVSSNYGPVTTIMLRLNSEHIARHRQNGSEPPKSPHQTVLPDIHALPLRSVHSQPLQSLQLRGSTRQQLELQDSIVGDGLMDIRGDTFNQLPQPLGDDGTRWRSMSRRGSDYIFSPLGTAATSTGPQQQQQQLRQQLQQLHLQTPGSPAPSAAASGCSSPATGASSGLPTIPAAYGGGFYFSRPIRRSSSNNPLGLRSSSRTQMQPSWATDELEVFPACSVDDSGGRSATVPLIITERAFPEEEEREGEIAPRGATVDLDSLRFLSPVPDTGLAAAASIPMGASYSRPAGGALPRVRVNSPVGRTRSYTNIMMGTSPTGAGSQLRTVLSTQRKVGPATSQLGA
ncbi:hypothetical protein VaNZ11_014445 [Volvox africanus]|uniref:Uncharacterized protein n=1 Tax=Volvox africanus TaxID=51714 RepID=A0ABQ5SJ18_9CHLO|nr:hypothetical protein VaNZ11_014445 [Volvox africanus]